MVLVFAALVGAWGVWVAGIDPYARTMEPAIKSSATQAPIDAAEAERCKVPDFAKTLGHEDKGKFHDNCK